MSGNIDVDGEASLDWRKSRASGSGNCVQVAVASAGGRILVRNSKHPAAGMASFTPTEWEAFLTGVRNGEFDLSPAGTLVPVATAMKP